ncbi:glucosaminidase domain-containing protein [Psychromonas sp.]|uniref:glucosaminidase domain-containing protein n=1 Tax=Psychromonas sp. TaxID=1884585 RepID=UPI0035630EA3
MKNNLFRMICALALTISLIISGCSTPDKTVTTAKTKTAKAKSHADIQPISKAPLQVTVSSVDELNALFDKYQYSSESWESGQRELPRITFAEVGEHWQTASENLPVKTKKSLFFRLMAPLILIANENILREREIVKSSALNSPELKKIALKYRLIKNRKGILTTAMRKKLLQKVDILPPSLALAQAAEESGWGTSRFAKEGNAFFGQWDFSGNGMKPKRQRKELGNYGVARFDSPLESVEAYMLNINTGNAYQKLRRVRAEIRAKDKNITGLELAGTLDKYSERGQDYIDGLRHLIQYNNLQLVDTAYLSNNRLIHLIPN